MRFLALTAAALLAAAALAVLSAALGDIAERRAELAAERFLADTRHGAVAYARWGAGAPVLAVHGAGGGHDQARLIVSAFGGADAGWIAPSRFGYPGSALPADASTAAQADAFADLLDRLGVSRVAVLAFSGGVPPALQLALRHPDRVSRMALLSSAPFTPYQPDRAARPIPDWAYQTLFGNDLAYWTLSRLAPGATAQAFDIRPDLLALATPEERAFAARLADAFLPASDRFAGVANEGAAIAPAARYEIERITVPVLVVHSRDDALNPFAIAEALAARLPSAKVMFVETGGHLLLGHHAQVRARLAAFLAADDPAP